MAGKHGSARAFFLVDGFNMLAAKLQGIRFKKIIATQKSDGVGDSWPEHTPTGSQSAELAQEGGFFDTATGSIHEAMAGSIPDDPQETVRIGALGFAGNEIGAPFVGFKGLFNPSYEVLAENGNLQRANAEYVVTGDVEDGVVLHAFGTETADANTEADSVDHGAEPQQVIPITSSSVANPSVITTTVPHGRTTGDKVLIAGHAGSTPAINGEHVVTVTGPTTFTIPVNVTVGGAGGTLTVTKTNAGGAGYLEVESVTLGGHTNATIALRDSDDDITFADLLTFTAVTARGAQRVEVAGAVERYLAASLDFTGAGSGPSIKFFAGFARF